MRAYANAKDMYERTPLSQLKHTPMTELAEEFKQELMLERNAQRAEQLKPAALGRRA